MPCLTENELSALVAGSVANEDPAWEHLSTCDACARVCTELLAVVPVEEGPLSELRTRFALRRRLGRGPHGVTWLATDLEHGHEVALKVLSASLAPGWHEALDSVRALRHPGVTSLLEAGVLGRCAFTAHAFVEGPSLATALPLDPSRVQQLAGQLCEALQAAHDHSVVHGEVCPTNVLLGSTGATLRDFGLAQVMRRSARDDVRELRLSWLAPEVRAGQPLTPQADQYSLARTLWVARWGTPFRLDRMADTDDPFVSALRRALSPEPSARFSSMMAFSMAWR